MRLSSSLFAIALLLPACASAVWDKRVYDCEDVVSVEVDRSDVEVSNDEGDCYVEVQNLSNHEVQGGVLSGSELYVYVSGSVALNVSDTTLNVEVDGLVIEGPRGAYQWFPELGSLEATDVANGTLYVDGPIQAIVLDKVGYADLYPGAGFTSLGGRAQEVDLSTQEVFAEIDVEVDNDLYLEVPGNEVYKLDLDAGGYVDVDGSIRSGGAKASSKITAKAGNDITIVRSN
jgi:hypothetical protein